MLFSTHTAILEYLEKVTYRIWESPLTAGYGGKGSRTFQPCQENYLAITPKMGQVDTLLCFLKETTVLWLV